MKERPGKAPATAAGPVLQAKPGRESLGGRVPSVSRRKPRGGYYPDSTIAGPNASQDMAHFTQTSNPFPTAGQYQGQYQEEAGKVDDEINESDDDAQTITTGRALKRFKVTIKKRMLSGKLYFVDAKGKERDTTKSKWRRVEKEYELPGRKYLYVTSRFP